MYARYVRPGARRIDCSGGVSGNFGTLAFYHPTDTCLAIILINGTATAEPATLSVTGNYRPAQLTAFCATEAQEVVNAGTVALNGTYTMPPNSVSTLVAGKYRSTAAVAARSVTARAAPANTSLAGRLYALDGRRIEARAVAAGRTAAAIGIFVAEDQRGTRTVVGQRQR